MFDDKENLVGVVFLGICAVVVGVVVWEIVTGNRLSYGGPQWLMWVLGAVFFGAIIYGMVQSFGQRRQGGGREQWPNPSAGRKPWWRRIFGR